MKIRSDQMESLLQAEQARAKKAGQGQEGFAGLLDQEVSKASGLPEKSTSTVLPPLSGGLLGADSIQAVEAVEAVGDESLSALDGLLDQWENYAASLGSDATLKQADAGLSDIEAQVARVKELTQDSPELSAIADELEVLAVTERNKLNRGDYS